MDVTVSDQRVFVVETMVTQETAAELAERNRLAAFGQLSKLMSRSRADEVVVSFAEERYDPFWNVSARKYLRYDRTKRYHVPASDASVKSVTFQDVDYPVTDGRYSIQALDHCQDEVVLETTVDALTSSQVNMPAIMAAPRREMGATFDLGDAVVVPPDVRASMLIQKLMGMLITPYEADQIFEERITVERVDLIYRPYYVFDCTWQAKNKVSKLEVDAVTAEVEVNVSRNFQGIRGVVNRELLFDIGAETLNLVVPGGAIAVRIGKAIADRKR
jgi:hypothetical protein